MNTPSHRPATNRTATLFAALFLIASTANAVTRYVSPSGNNTIGNAWGTAFKQIQAAIDASSDGDTIAVTNGFYAPFIVSNKTVIIRSINGAGVTVIDGGNTNRCATFVWDADVARNSELHGFTLHNGTAPLSGSGWQSRMSGDEPENSFGGGTYGGTLYDCAITGNRAKYGAGAFNAELNRCRVTGNVSSWDGGGTFGCTVNSSLMWDNSAKYGGGTYDCVLNNCTVVGNRASGNGGGMFGGDAYNAIVWDNSPDNGNAWLEYSCTAPLHDGEGNTASDPLFANPAGGDFRLTFASPCAGAGSTGLVARDWDLYGNPLVQDGRVSMGAVAATVGFSLAPSAMETDSAGAQNLSFAVATADAGMTWTATTTDSWITLAASNGTGAGAVVFSVAPASVQRTGGITVSSGGDSVVFTLTQTLPQALTWYVDETVSGGNGTSWATAFATIQQAVDAAGSGGKILVAPGTYAPIVTANKAVTIRGIGGAKATIIDGNNTRRCADLWDEAADPDGMPSRTNTVLTGFTLRNGRVTGTDGAHRGAGARGGTLNRCILADNTATYAGGAAAYSVLNDCTLARNTAQYGGGATQCILHRCRVQANTAQIGGGVHWSHLHSSIVQGNTADNYAGGVSGGSTDADRGSLLINCTVYDNTGGGVHGGTLRNTIAWGNTSSNYSGTPAATYSCTTPAIAGAGNTTLDPMFQNAAAGDFRLRPGSSCTDAGAPGYITLDTDFLGSRLIDANGNVNIGALSSVGRTLRGTPYTWHEANNFVTQGSPHAAYDSADLLDPDGDGCPNWEEYVAGTHPGLAVSCFTTRIGITNAAAHISWVPDLPDRAYTVYGKASLADPGPGSAPPTPPTASSKSACAFKTNKQ